MHTKPYTHPANAKGPTYKLTTTGSRLVHPGETVMVPDTGGKKMVEAAKAPTPAKPDEAALGKLLDGSIKDIEPQLAGMDDATLATLRKLEQARPQPRSTLLSAIDETDLSRKTQ